MSVPRDQAAGLPQEKIDMLSQLVSRDNLQERAGRGQEKFFYIDKDYVSEALDEVFGPLSWSRTTVKIEQIDSIEQVGKTEKWIDGRKQTIDCIHFAITVMATVRVEISVGDRTIVREGTGVDTNNGPLGEGFAVTSKGDIIATAMKSAESDAFKRACNSLGYLFGRNIDKNGQKKMTLAGEPPAAKAEMQRGAPQQQPARPAPAAPKPAPAAAPKADPVKPAQAAAEPAKPAAVEPAKPAPAKAEPAKVEPAKVDAPKAGAQTTKAPPIPPAPGPNDTVATMQKHMQGVYNHARFATTAAELETVIELMSRQREACKKVSGYYKFYDYTMTKLVERAGEIAPELEAQVAALKIPDNEIPDGAA